MKKVGLFTLAAMALITGGIINAHQVSADTEQQPSEEKFDTRIFRIYNPNTGEHLLTPSGWEIVVLEKEGWKAEGVAFYAPQAKPPYSGYPIVQRLYNPNAGDHHYTTSNFEVMSLVSVGWSNDGENFTFPVAKANTGVPVYRLYNPNAKVGSHHFTMSSFERDSLIKAGWKNEGIAFTAYTNKKNY
ncbi:hypothetical protein EFE32_11395 [Lactococcus lactis subsp. lactis]|uniref:hypothetical protein n=1 Tax=Lactococcus lactis TaxID=1358 RepID=UPI00223A7964|nr:hypothetical protein [Lactococcus lactis]MCT0017394.1 hypothetical protein [Lactococcus lactis subsp. lactis]